MKQNTLRNKIGPGLWFFGYLSCLLVVFGSCTKVDKYYETLQDLPQILNASSYMYSSAYVVDDTLTIYGNLMPEKEFSITIGGVKASITEVDSIRPSDVSNLGVVDVVSVLITKEMIGNDQEVKVTAGNHSVLGANIAVYDKFGSGSLQTELSVTELHNLSGKQPIFLHCINGKGEIYYYSNGTKKLVHIAKDGTESTLYDLSGPLTTDEQTLTEFIAGGVDPQGKNVYFSANVGTAYILCHIDLESGQLTLLNRSISTTAPYESHISKVNMLVSGVYPDTEGNLYLAVGLNKDESSAWIPDGIARYDVESENIQYVYNRIFLGYATDMPGKAIDLIGSVKHLRFSPDEKLLYVLQRSYANDGAAIELFDLEAGIKLNAFSPGSSGISGRYNVIVPFSQMRIKLSAGIRSDNDFGYLPMPGKRLQALLFNLIDSEARTTQLGFPKWIVFDFNEKRTYAYAPGRFRRDNYEIRNSDEVLNFDEDGQLYFTSNGKAYLLKTKAR